MSLFKSINNIFSKGQSDQLVGISLQQESIALCLLPSLVTTTYEENTPISGGIFQHEKVNQLDYSGLII